MAAEWRWLYDHEDEGCTWFRCDQDIYPGVVRFFDTTKWIVWPAGVRYHSSRTWEVSLGQPLYPTKEAAMAACRLIYGDRA